MSEKDVQTPQNEEQEIDLIALVKRLWEKRMFVIYVTAAFMVVGVLVALFSPKKYNASVVISPQMTDSKSGGTIAAAASMLGISMGGNNSGDPISPVMYPMLMDNANMQKELIYTGFKFEDQDTLVTFIDYFTSEPYNHPTFFSAVKKYTIGLPGTIIGAIRGKNDSDTVSVPVDGSSIHTFTKEEDNAVKLLKSMVSVSYNDKEMYVTISTETGEPLFSAELAERVKDLMQKYVTAAKIEKAQDNYNFVQARFKDAEKEYQDIQMEYAKFMDANQGLTSAVALTKRTALEREYQFASNLYNEVARLLLQADIKVKEDTPTFTIVQPVKVPLEKSKPRRSMILIAFVFLGVCIGCGAVFGLDFLKKQGSKWPRRWTLLDEAVRAAN